MRWAVVFGILLLTASCRTKDTRFELIEPEISGILFGNFVTESDSFNILSYEYIYNGGGVGLGDFDNDSLIDVFFTGNMVANQLYLNKGNFRFEDITEVSGTAGDGRWCSGVNVIDINADGLLDLYICVTAHPEAERRKNLLYVNGGLNEEGMPVFTEMAEAYNLADTMHTSQAAFFDFDRDGDLDVFLANNKMVDGNTPNDYKVQGADPFNIDRLYRNDWNDSLGHPYFVDFTESAGIVQNGFSLGVTAADINLDGWCDLYVTNDYLTQDLVLINQHDGRFIDKASDYFRHTCYSAMGNDVVDLTNDGYPEVIALDMLPEDNYRRKTMLGPNNYTTYINNEKYGFQYQFIKNVLQQNRGNDPSTGEPVFSEVGFTSGISATDWSWTPLAADFDNDGLKDLIITNGFPKDITDRDFVDYHAQTRQFASNSFLLQSVPSVKLRNYAFRNAGQLSFEDVTSAWGIEKPTFSNGAAYADLDNDGDLDYVVNNINDPAHCYRNLHVEKGLGAHWVRVALQGPKANPRGVGAKVYAYAGGTMWYAEKASSRGYLSSSDDHIHFGLGSVTQLDSIVVTWPDGSRNMRAGIQTNAVHSFSYEKKDTIASLQKPAYLFKDQSHLFGDFVHQEADFVDFNVQPLLLHKYSQYGPSLAVGDINGDGLDDVYVGGSYPNKGTFFIQSSGGKFAKTDLFGSQSDPMADEMGTLFFDADGDNDLDMYIARGGYEFPKDDSLYADHFLENRGGRFFVVRDQVPSLRSSNSCVRAADFDGDGDLDLFVGSNIVPRECPTPSTSYLLRNDSEPGIIRFTLANDVLPELNGIGMVTDALWTDFNNDGKPDLLLALEWGPLRLFQNAGGSFQEITNSSGLSEYAGWWSSLGAADFDNDGDIDYVAGNHGTNTLLKATAKEPVSVYYADFDNNGTMDMIPSTYFKLNRDGERAEFPYFGRVDVQKEMIAVKRRFLKYSDYGNATLQSVLPDSLRSGAKLCRVNHLYTSYIENLGGGRFKVVALPVEAQLAPVFGIITNDFTGDGITDVILTGNDYGTEVLMGRSDASIGTLLAGTGTGGFVSLPLDQTGLVVNGDAKALVQIRNREGSEFLIASQNRGKLKCYQPSQYGERIMDSPPLAMKAIVELADGRRLTRELYYGNGFLSQSSRRIAVPSTARKIVFINFDGKSQEVLLDREAP